MIIHLIVGLIKKTLYKNDLSNYATIADIKNIPNVDTWSFSLKQT